MTKISFAATAAIGAALVAAAPAAAIVKIATYTGIVVYGYDLTGEFGTPNTDLAGANWTATFTYDKTLGGYQYSDLTADDSQGGTSVGTGSPILSATITINGVTKTGAGQTLGKAYTSSTPAVAHLSDDSLDDAAAYLQHYIYAFGYPAGAPASLDQNFGPAASSNGYGYVNWIRYDKVAGSYLEYAYAYLGSDSVYSVSDVPEPASWALMIGGFGMVGAALRRRSTTVAA